MTSTGPADSRGESAAERAGRNLAELLQDLRVVGLGVQVLFGFLFSLPLPTGSPGSATASVIVEAAGRRARADPGFSGLGRKGPS